MDDKNRHSDEHEVKEAFGRDLKKLYGPKGRVPGRVDMAVLSQAGRRLARRPAMPWKWAGIAAAAAVLLLVMLNLEQGPSVAVLSEVAEARIAKDIDGNGRVDMLDALKIAKLVEAGNATTAFDFNGDGVVNNIDIDAVAMAAVKLEKGS